MTLLRATCICLTILLQLRPRDRARAMSALRAVMDLTEGEGE